LGDINALTEITSRSAKFLERITENLDESFSGRMRKWYNYFLGFYAGLSYKIINSIVDISRSCGYVFIDTSQYGVLASHLKKKGYQGKIISFFHNVEISIHLQDARVKPLNSWRIFQMYVNEKAALKYSDVAIALNERDRKLLGKFYKIKPHDIIPISFIDKFARHFDSSHNNKVKIPPTALFIGNKWHPNIHGIKWFISNVLDQVELTLQIAGGGLEEFKNELKHPKVEFLGFVADLDPVIENADVMIYPIFKGGGMKVKTCEALMFGKNILGTSEVFVGYDLDFRKVGALCNTKNDFITNINELQSRNLPKYNEYCRNIYLEKYSFEATLKQFQALICANA
jgi:polysaccharide biosynthesis protein PslH